MIFFITSSTLFINYIFRIGYLEDCKLEKPLKCSLIYSTIAFGFQIIAFLPGNHFFFDYQVNFLQVLFISFFVFTSVFTKEMINNLLLKTAKVKQNETFTIRNNDFRADFQNSTGFQKNMLHDVKKKMIVFLSSFIFFLLFDFFVCRLFLRVFNYSSIYTQELIVSKEIMFTRITLTIILFVMITAILNNVINLLLDIMCEFDNNEMDLITAMQGNIERIVYFLILVIAQADEEIYLLFILIFMLKGSLIYFVDSNISQYVLINNILSITFTILSYIFYLEALEIVYVIYS